MFWEQKFIPKGTSLRSADFDIQVFLIKPSRISVTTKQLPGSSLRNQFSKRKLVKDKKTLSER